MDISKIKNILRKFSSDRDWDQFHNPKNLVMALSVETAELVEIFQWLNERQSKITHLSDQDRLRIKEEMADILIYLIQISDKLDINLEKVVLEKIKLNEKKYPIDISKGSSKKYYKI